MKMIQSAQLRADISLFPFLFHKWNCNITDVINCDKIRSGKQLLNREEGLSVIKNWSLYEEILEQNLWLKYMQKLSSCRNCTNLTQIT